MVSLVRVMEKCQGRDGSIHLPILSAKYFFTQYTSLVPSI